MNKPWLGYVSSALFLIAGIFQIVAHKYVIGGLFVLVCIASIILNIRMYRRKD